MKTKDGRLFPTMENLRALITQGYSANTGVQLKDIAKDNWFNSFTLPVFYLGCTYKDYTQLMAYEKKDLLTSKISTPVPYLGMLKGYSENLAMIGIDFGVRAEDEDMDPDGDCKLYILVFEDTWDETYGSDDGQISFPLCDGAEVFINLNGTKSEWAFEIYHPIGLRHYVDKKSASMFGYYDGTIKVIGIALTPYLNGFPYIRMVVQGNDDLKSDEEGKAKCERIVNTIEEQKQAVTPELPLKYELTIDGPVKALNGVEDPYLKMMLGHNTVPLMVDPREIDTSWPDPRVMLYYSINPETGGIVISSSKMSLDFVKQTKRPE